MGPYVKEGMALDLTPYLDADNGAWRKTFNETLLNIGNYNGKIYSVPLETNFPIIIVNKDLLASYGITIPENWNWDQFLDVCSKIKAKGLFPFAMPTDNQKQDWMISNGLLSLAGSKNMLEQMKTADVACTDQIFTECFTKIKDVYDKDYMYPGKGAVTLTTDEGRAAFYQKKVAFTAEVAAGVSSVIKDAKFNCEIIPWPSMGTKNYVMGGCGGLFVPANAKDPEASVEVLKAYTSAKVMQIAADHGYAVANNQVTITDPIVKKEAELSSQIYAYEFKTFDTKLNDYVISKALPEIVLGDGPDACAKAMEAIRKTAKAAAK
jgi:ABC-type glycerol-3-phosphate transport system substrate-binding protein